MVYVGALVLNRLMGIFHTLNNFYANDFQQGVPCLKILMSESFGCSIFFNFVIVNIIVSKNLKILKNLGQQ